MAGEGAYGGAIAGVVWGAAFDKTLAFGFPMLDAVTYPQRRGTPDAVRSKVAELDTVSYDADSILRFRLPAVPGVTEADPYGFGAATGWDDVDGWRDFLVYARLKRTLRFAPVLLSYDGGLPATFVECKLVEPWDEAPSSGWATRREITVRLRATGGARFEGY